MATDTLIMDVPAGNERGMKLKPCPFCAGSAEMRNVSGAGWCVICGTCQSQTYGGSDVYTAYMAWNRRDGS